MPLDPQQVNIFEDSFRKKVNQKTREEEDEEQRKAKEAALRQLQQAQLSSTPKA